MANLSTQANVSKNHVAMVNGKECVVIYGKLPETLTNDSFEELTGCSAEFITEWAANGYPLACNGWLLSPVASHIGSQTDPTYAVTFNINNAVFDGEMSGTYAMYQISLENGEVKAELQNVGGGSTGQERIIVARVQFSESKPLTAGTYTASQFRVAFGFGLDDMALLYEGDYALVGDTLTTVTRRTSPADSASVWSVVLEAPNGTIYNFLIFGLTDNPTRAEISIENPAKG